MLTHYFMTAQCYDKDGKAILGCPILNPSQGEGLILVFLLN